MTGPSVTEVYAGLVAAGELKADPDQAAAATALGKVQAELEAVPPRGRTLWRVLGKEAFSVVREEVRQR